MAGRILIIRGGAIGDFILTLPALRLLRESFPEVEIEVLGYKEIIGLAERAPYAAATRSIEYAALSAFFVPGGELSEELAEYFASFSTIISYLYDPDNFFHANLERCGARDIIRADPRISEDIHAVYQLAQPLEALALYLDEPGAVLTPSPADQAAIEPFFSGTRFPRVALHPGSGSESKNWPLPHWRELLHFLELHPANPSIFILGGEADSERIRALAPATVPPRFHVVENLPLPQLAALLSRCDLFLGHDSGISHLAGAVGTRSLLLFGPTDAEVWAPLGRHVEILRVPDKKLERLEAGAVIERVEELLSSLMQEKQAGEK